MAQCTNCRITLAAADTFCGNCGTRASPAVTTHTPASAVSSTRLDWTGDAAFQPAESISGRFFRHATRRPGKRLSNATRYLCAAAYLNPAYANLVIAELVTSRRAVVPSIGFDLGPIIRHCLNARSIQLARDCVLTAILLLALVLATAPTIVVIVIAFGLAVLFSGNRERRSALIKFFIALAVVAILIVAAVYILRELSQSGSGLPGIGLVSSGTWGVIVAVAFAALSAFTVFVTTYNKHRILGQRLRPGADAAGFNRPSDRVQARIAEVEAAQQGNVTLYAGENPFIGSGRTKRAWSIAIELDRAAPGGAEVWMKPEARGSVRVDPVELHAVIRERLLKLKDSALPENERISALEVADHVVGEGRDRTGGPLMDPARKVPYSEASQEAINALIRHPQAGLRYYQRVSVNDEGQPVLSGGQQVLDSADHEIAVSAFVYVAVEGRMLYVEFISTVLPPVQRKYHVIDLLAKLSPGKFLTLVTTDAVKELFGSMIGAPFGVFGTLRLMVRESKSDEDEITSIDEYLNGDSGARISVRETAGARSPQTYIQELDAAKYTKIIERLLNDTVLDFLVSKGIDTAAYRASASIAINNGTVISGGSVNGTVVGGLGATATVTQAQVTTPAPAAH